MTWEEFCRQAENEKKSIIGCQVKIDGLWFLIGDINDEGGVCNDCRAFDRGDEIQDVVWPENGVIKLKDSEEKLLQQIAKEVGSCCVDCVDFTPVIIQVNLNTIVKHVGDYANTLYIKGSNSTPSSRTKHLISERQMEPMKQIKFTWQTVHEIKDEESGLAVQINKRTPGVPYYSYSIGQINGRGNFKPFIQPYITRENGQVDVKLYVNLVFELISVAQSWIVQQVISDYDTYLAGRIIKEEAQLAKHKPETERTGKTEREAAKRARHA